MNEWTNDPSTGMIHDWTEGPVLRGDNENSATWALTNIILIQNLFTKSNRIQSELQPILKGTKKHY